MKELNQEKSSKVIAWIKKAIDVNQKTEKSANISLNEWNDVEVRLYENKEVKSDPILYELVSLYSEVDYEEEQKIEAIDSFFTLTLKQLK